jgi:hypothetical protein
VILHTGSFIPRGFVSPTGAKDDYANQMICRRLAMRGYVAVSIEYRLGWDPQNSSDLVRRATIIQAAYRAVQDLSTFIRFANMTVEDLGNPFRIDPNKIAVFGVGTGGFVALNAAVLNEQNEIYIPKFSNPVTGDPFIDTTYLGNLTGETMDTLNIPNHVGYSNAFHYVFSLDGGVGDSSWIEMGADVTIPMSLVGVVGHPTTPFGIDELTGEINCELPVFVAGTGDFVVNIAGTACVANKANALGINDPIDYPFDDEITAAISGRLYAQPHLWPIHLPGNQAGPWEYWDSTFWKMVPHPSPEFDNIHIAALQTNPDMSIAKANAYIDTALWFFAPRACVALGLGGCTTVGTEVLSEADYPYAVYPNPTDNRVRFEMLEGNSIGLVEVFDQTGRLVQRQDGAQQSVITIDISTLPPGFYVLKSQLREGVVSARIMKR